MTFLTIQLGAVLVRNVFSQSGHWSLVSQQLLVLLLWFFLYSPVKRGFITINQNYKSGIPYVWQTHPRSQVREGTFLFFVLCNARLWKQQITQPCMFVPAKRLCQNAPPPASPSLWRQWPGAKMCGCSSAWPPGSLFTPHPVGPQRAAPLHVTGSATPAIWSSISVVPSLNEFEGKQGAGPEGRHFLTLPYDLDSSQCNVCLEN